MENDFKWLMIMLMIGAVAMFTAISFDSKANADKYKACIEFHAPEQCK